MVKIFILIALTRAISFISQFLNIGSGGTWPGEIALFLDNKIFEKLAGKIENRIILISGTNGKTTTSKLLWTILNKEKFKVIRNASGGNVLNGLTSSLLSGFSILLKPEYDFYIFEVDEAVLPLVVSKISPKLIILLNLFRDQLDRYGEINIIALKWQNSFARPGLKSDLILNADDPLVASIGENFPNKKYFFGLENKKNLLNKIPHTGDSTYCLSCNHKLNYQGIYFSHLGNWQCPKCKIKKPLPDIREGKWEYPLEGVYNRYNVLAAVLTAKLLKISEGNINQALKTYSPAFGRQESLNVNGKNISIMLSKNPVGFNESIRTVNQRNNNRKTQNLILLVLNDRIPDGRDVSWIYDVDFYPILKNFREIIISGDRFLDMGLRIKYEDKFNNFNFYKNEPGLLKYDKKSVVMFKNLQEALNYGLKKCDNKGTFFIMPTYSGMLDVRKILTGRKIL